MIPKIDVNDKVLRIEFMTGIFACKFSALAA